MKVPFLDLPRLHGTIRSDLTAALDRVAEQASFVGGMEVRAFEESFASAHGAAAAAGCGSGTDALSLALRALGVGPGDDVIVPSMTFVATAEAVVHVGATPVVADVDQTSLLLTPSAVDRVRTERTKAVIPVHLYGHVVPFSDLEGWVADGLLVVEDAAQAHLATWCGRPVGSVGHAACFSFYPGKNLGALGDGGMVISRDPALVAEVRRRGDHGRTSKYLHEVPGYCSRLDGLQAAFLAAKLSHLRSWTDARCAIAEHYRERLGDLLVPWEEGAVHHLLVTRVGDRDSVQRALSEAEIVTGLHYPIPLSRQPWLVEATVETPVAEQAAGQVLSLPIDPLMTTAEAAVVCDALERAVDEDERLGRVT